VASGRERRAPAATFSSTDLVRHFRARIVEIAPLAERFLAVAGQTLGQTAPFRLAPETLGYLERYTWPGNVRELRNCAP